MRPDFTLHTSAIQCASTDVELSAAVAALASDLAAHYILDTEAPALIEALQAIDPWDLDVPDLVAECIIAAAYGDLSGLEGLGLEVSA